MMLGNLISRSYHFHIRMQGWILLPKFSHITLSSILCRAYSSKYSHFYRILELPDNSDKESVRRKYIELVKLYHPDTTSDFTDKFSEIDVAYKSLQRKFKEDEMREEESAGEYGLYYKEKVEEEEHEYPEIDHIAPQHRQYLDHGGIGSGTPSQRQKQNQKYRAFKANEAVFEHRMGRLTAQYETRIATQERNTIKKQTTRNQIERLVEDLIQESMASGEFDNLAGKGKPLPNRVDYNPYADFTTHKMNQILAEGGFAPEWVMLRKDIRDQFTAIRGELKKKRPTLGPLPLSPKKLHEWELICSRIEMDSVRNVNKQIDKFNLIVPILQGQMFQFNMKSEAKKILEVYDPTEDSKPEPKPASGEKLKSEKGMLQDIFEKIFKSSSL